MRKTILALALVLAMSANAFAGDMQFGVINPPTPEPTPTTSVAVGPHAGGALTTEEADTLTETLLNLIDSVLALF